MMEFMQECINELNGPISHRRQYDLAVSVYNFGDEITHDESIIFVKPYTIGCRYNVNKSFFVMTYGLHRIFSGWIMVDMNGCNQITFEKKCRDPIEGIWILNLVRRVINAFDIILIDDWKQNGGIVTVSISTQIIPKCCEIGLMF